MLVLPRTGKVTKVFGKYMSVKFQFCDIEFVFYNKKKLEVGQLFLLKRG